MRIKEEFGAIRKSEIKDYNPKYFIISEGSASEPLYFEGLNNSVLSENITIINILRDYANLTNSHPSFIIKMLKELILNVEHNEITILELKNKIANCIKDNDYKINMEDIYNRILSIYKNDDCRIKKDDLNDLFMKLFKGEIYKDLAINFPIYFETQDITYSKPRDKINIVIDRDKQNFKDYQYDEVSLFCKQYEINLYVSNPTFEFFLLLHFPTVLDEDRDIMFKNKYIGRKRYLERRLHDICNYKKSSLDFKVFEPYIYDAIEREKLFAEDILELKYKLGSNVGLLIKEMLNAK